MPSAEPPCATGPDVSASGGLRRSLGLVDLVVYGVVYMAPVAAFTVFGFIMAASHGAIVMSYVVGCAAMILTALSYAAMARRAASAGSVYAYARLAFGDFAGFVAGWAILLDYILIPALLVLLGAILVSAAIPGLSTLLCTIGFVLLASAINFVGVAFGAKLNLGIAGVQMVLVVLFVGAGALVLYSAPGLAGFTSEPLLGLARQPSLVLAGASIAVMSFLGFDAISTLSEEVRTGGGAAIGRATVICVLLMALIFIAQSWVLADLSRGVACGEPGNAAFEVLHARVPWLSRPVAIITGLSTGIGAAIPPQAAVSRILFAMARSGQLPRALEAVHPRFRTPWVSLSLVTLVMLGVSVLFLHAPETLLSVCNFGALVAFLFVNASVIGSYGVRSRSRAVLAHWLAPALGLIVIAYIIANLDRFALEVGSAWLAVGIAYYGIMRLGRKAAPSIDADALAGAQR